MWSVDRRDSYIKKRFLLSRKMKIFNLSLNLTLTIRHILSGIDNINRNVLHVTKVIVTSNGERPMGTEKERLRRWREKNRAKGKKSYTIMLSREAQLILKREKERSRATYSSVIERALLRLAGTAVNRAKEEERGVASNVTSNDELRNTRLLIDDEVAMKGFRGTNEYGAGKIEENRGGLSKGLIPRLLRMSKKRTYRLKK